MPYADLEDVRLYYERAGSGARELLFVPGWCCDHRAFGLQFDHFARTQSVTVGTGHFHQLEVPEQVNAMIERFLAISF